MMVGRMENNELVAIVLIVLIVTVGVYFTVSAVYQPKQSANIPTPLSQATIMSPQTMVSHVQTVATTNSESTSPIVIITSQECKPDNHNSPVVTTVLRNKGNKTIIGDFILKIYKEENVLLGTFPQSVMLPPNGEISIKTIMYGVNYFQADTMSTEFPSLEQSPPPRINSGYQCPGFRKA